MRIFLDANVLFSAAKSDGAVRQLLRLLEKSGHECCVDGYVIEEARRNLVAKAPDRVVVLEGLLSRMKTARCAARRRGARNVTALAREGQAGAGSGHPPTLFRPGHRRSHAFRGALRPNHSWRNHPLAAVAGRGTPRVAGARQRGQTAVACVHAVRSAVVGPRLPRSGALRLCGTDIDPVGRAARTAGCRPEGRPTRTARSSQVGAERGQATVTRACPHPCNRRLSPRGSRQAQPSDQVPQNVR